MRIGIGDINSDAAAKLQAAGYAGAQCMTQHVPFPGGAGYDQNICSIPGYSEGFEAGATLAMTPAELAAVRNQVVVNPGSSYLTSPIGGFSPGSIITNLTPGAGVIPSSTTPSTVATQQPATVSQPTQNQIAAATNTPPANASAVPVQQQTQNPVSTSTFEIPSYVWAIAAAFGGFMLLKGK